MDSTSEAQQTAAERLAEQQLGELVAFAAGQLEEPAVEHAEAQGAPPPVAAGANGIWGGETTPSLPSVDSELDNNVSRALGVARLIWIVLCCTVLLSPVQPSPVRSVPSPVPSGCACIYLRRGRAPRPCHLLYPWANTRLTRRFAQSDADSGLGDMSVL